MSEFYDLTKPYKIEDWNNLVEAVNETLQNPPEGTDCEAIDELETVEDPHRWAVEDIEDMRDALIETCSGIGFEEELILWKSGIIDEIETQMEQAWCDCEGSGNCISFSDSVEGGWIYAAFSEAASGGALFEDFHGTLCPGIASSQTVWISTWYPPVDHSALRAEARAAALRAQNAGGEFRDAWNDMLSSAYYMRSWQGAVNEQVAEVNINIELYEDCIAEQAALPEGGDSSVCDPYKELICEYGTKAKEYQEKVNEFVSEFQSAETKRAPATAAADSAALENINAVLSMEGRFPRERNLFASVQSAVPSGMDWTRLIYPLVGFPPSRLGYVSRSPIPLGIMDVIPTASYTLSISPGGYVFTYSANPQGYVTETTVWLSRKEVRHRCEQWGGRTCPDDCGDDVPACEWKCWETDWDCGIGTGNPFTIVGCARESRPHGWDYDSLSGGSDSMSGYICRNPSTADYTEEQEEFVDTYSTWFDDHPQYDDRHEDYC